MKKKQQEEVQEKVRFIGKFLASEEPSFFLPTFSNRKWPTWIAIEPRRSSWATKTWART